VTEWENAVLLIVEVPRSTPAQSQILLKKSNPTWTQGTRFLFMSNEEKDGNVSGTVMV